jgi:hypothetical protein
MNSPKLPPAEAALIEAGLMTEAQAVQRIEELKATVLPARAAAMAACPPGLSGLAQALMLYDDGVFSAEAAIRSMRGVLGLGVITESRELGALEAAFYQGRFRGRASVPAVGGHYANL